MTTHSSEERGFGGLIILRWLRNLFYYVTRCCREYQSYVNRTRPASLAGFDTMTPSSRSSLRKVLGALVRGGIVGAIPGAFVLIGAFFLEFRVLLKHPGPALLVTYGISTIVALGWLTIRRRNGLFLAGFLVGQAAWMMLCSKVAYDLLNPGIFDL